MGDIAEFGAAHAARAARLASAADAARRHPALRWEAGADASAAHRRTPLRRTVCGEAGPLRLATPGTPPCPRCWPAAEGA